MKTIFLPLIVCFFNTSAFASSQVQLGEVFTMSKTLDVMPGGVAYTKQSARTLAVMAAGDICSQIEHQLFQPLNKTYVRLDKVSVWSYSSNNARAISAAAAFKCVSYIP